LESELFGHAKGAFTGAGVTRAGLFLAASGGTLFLDEVSELELAMQVRLLRVLQESEVRPVGSDRSIPIDTRVIAATNRPLSQLVDRGHMREDLFYRLNVFEIVVPPLRDRLEDLQPLSMHLLRKHSIKLGRPVPQISEQALRALADHPWPGNVRQLENVLERALIVCDEVIEQRHLEATNHPDLGDAPRSSGRRLRIPLQETSEVLPLRNAKDEFERQYLVGLLEMTDHNRAEAARMAKIDPSNLRRLLKRHGLTS
jgi:DNA-binding NtrC family response regulator